MEIKRVVRRKSEVLVGLRCDVCQVDYTDPLETQEFLRYRDCAGYGSVFGDMSSLHLDMCQHCLKWQLGQYIRVTHD